MKIIAVTQRTLVDAHGARHDALDQRWFMFFKHIDLQPILIPNDKQLAEALLHTYSFDGFLLTGGDDDTHRIEVEKLLMKHAMSTNKPLLGVCHGMQMIQRFFGLQLIPVKGHVQMSQTILIQHQEVVKNSYHDLGTKECPDGFEVWAKAQDGVVKAIAHQTFPIAGIMWHPERNNPFEPDDLNFIKQFFQGTWHASDYLSSRARQSYASADSIKT